MRAPSKASTSPEPDGEAAPLRFLGGLQLLSDNDDFGGLSGIDMLDGDTAFLIGDSGTFVRATLVRDEAGRLVGLADAEIGSLFPGWRRVEAAGRRRGHRLRPGRPARAASSCASGRPTPCSPLRWWTAGRTNFEPTRVGAEDRLLRSNRGLESVAYAPPASPLAGEIVTIAERPPRGQADIPAWIVGKGAFSIVRHDDFDVSSARFLPNGDLLLLERRQYFGWGMRLRRIAGSEIAIGAQRRRRLSAGCRQAERHRQHGRPCGASGRGRPHHPHHRLRRQSQHPAADASSWNSRWTRIDLRIRKSLAAAARTRRRSSGRG